MITTGFDKRVQVQQIIDNQLPEFLLSESPKAVDFLKQYYISQEYQGGNIDISDNLDQYLKLDNLTPEVVVGETVLSSGINESVTSIDVTSTKGFPDTYGLFQINNEVFTYTGITTNSFTGCVRGFSGITSYHASDNPGELVFSDTSATSHISGSTVINLSALFLKEFYKKTKSTLTPGLEDVDFVNNLDVSNFIKESHSLYQAKGTEESFRILFNILYNVTPKVVDLEEYLLKPSSAEFIRRELVLAEVISGDINGLVGQTIIKSTDSATRASVSEIEPITRGGKTYYKLGLFVGFNDVDLIEGTFNIPGKTKVINPVSVGSSVITVDSTIGFGATGTVICGVNTAVTYSSKSVNQFFGCTNIVDTINKADDLRSDEIYYGYDKGDVSKRVEFRITGVLSKFVPVSDIKLSSEGEKITVKNVGEKIYNPDTNKTKKEIFFNSWVYNTSSRFKIENITGSTVVLYTSDIDKSSIKLDDEVEILQRGSEILAATATVGNITKATKSIDVNNLILAPGQASLPAAGEEYDLRRKLRTAFSSVEDLEFGNNRVTSDISNVYNKNDKDFYVAANSLPSYDITESLAKGVLPEATSIPPSNYLQGYSNATLDYSILSFPSNVPFITGDAVYYEPQGTIMPGLEAGTYYVEVLANPNQIKIYTSRSFIPTSNCVRFNVLSAGSGTHTFTLVSSRNKKIGAQKLLKQFPLNPNIKNGKAVQTNPGTTGMLVNGVEIANYKSDNKIFYGPIKDLKIFNGGSGYDVINPPNLQISSPGTGTTALVHPVMSGSVTDVQVDPQNFDIDKIISVTITGGNGSGAVLEPVIGKRHRDIYFDARLSTNSGGIDITTDILTFLDSHNLSSGQAISYFRDNNPALGIGSYFGSNVGVGKTLINTGVYYPEVIDRTRIKLYETESDYNAGINTVGFTTESNSGTHRFRVYNEENTLKDIRVINSGSGYQNRQLRVKPAGINTITSTINFVNHGFNEGDKIVYDTAVGIGSTIPQSITGLVKTTGITTTTNCYKVIKIDNDSFRIVDVGLGATITSNYTRKNYIKFSDKGTGYQVFKYPDIRLNLSYELANTSVGVITATPIIKGPIVDAYLYEEGTGYGSDVLNLEKTATATIKNGKNAELKPIVTAGKITYIEIQNGGKDYNSAPDLNLVGVGTGFGGKLRAIVTAGKITDVIILDSGIQYQQDKTSINVVPRGSGAKLEPSIRGLTVNNFSRYGNEALLETNDQLEYSFIGYSTAIGNDVYGDTGLNHSPIIGWAYDGNPIYGPYGYSDSQDENSGIRILKPGYVTNTAGIVNRPSTTTFGSGFFVEDYEFAGNGDLDEYNGRYGRTPEFPNGIYAYFAGITTDTRLARFPYFIGDKFRSNPTEANYSINQNNFDFKAHNLIRNTYPYKVSDSNADNDFIIESNEIIDQTSVIEGTTKGNVDSFQIIAAGSGYKIGDNIKFDNTATSGGGLSAEVGRLQGKEITSVETTVNEYNDPIFVWKNPNEVSAYISTSHALITDDNIAISGIKTTGSTSGTYSIKNLAGTHKVGVTTARTVLFQELDVPSNTGIITDIYVSSVPDRISVGSSIGIGTEKLRVLNVFDQRSILRVQRGVAAAAHTVSTFVDLIPSFIDLPVQTPYFDSKLDDVVYFNPHQSIGVGTVVGLGTTSIYTQGESSKVVNIPTHSIYLPNHPFTHNQEVVLRKPAAGYALTVTTDGGATKWNIPDQGNSQTVYIVDKSDDYIGIATVNLGIATSGVAFIGDNTVGSSLFDYSLESNFTQITGTLQQITANVGVLTSHGLLKGDEVVFEVKSNQSVGIGNSVSIDVSYDPLNETVLINPINTNSSGVNINDDTINIVSHGFKTGDKVHYTSPSVAGGLVDKGTYFVYKQDDNSFKLGQNEYDVVNVPATIINITSNGGGSANHEFSLINPRIAILENNNLVFDVSDASLSGYEFKLFYDNDYKNEFVSTGKTDSFTVTGVGTVGVTSTAKVTLNYTDDNPRNLFYNVQKSGFISTADTDVSNYTSIIYDGSDYNGKYNVFGIGATTFSISLGKVPESLAYSQSNTSSLKYTTKSSTARGGIDEVKLNFGGAGYKKLPSFTSIGSTEGINANILPLSKNINRIDDVRILDPGYEYSSDPTLTPEAFVPPVISIINNTKLSGVTVVDGGKNYTSVPGLVIVDPDTGKEITTGYVEGVINSGSSSLSSVNVILEPKGLTSVEHNVFAINNTNGLSVNTVEYNPSTGIVTCVLTTPVLGFSTSPFSVGEKIFVEGIQKYGTGGNGFNSPDNSFKFYEVTSFSNTNPAELEFSLAGIATNPGVAKTSQNSYANIISKDDYPIFKVTQEISKFNLGEKLLSLIGTEYVAVDLTVVESNSDSIKVNENTPGAFELIVGQLIRGVDSGTIATINTIDTNKAQFEVNYSLRQDQGWTDNIGKLNEDYQVVPDNDYYQNLSYTVKSPITYEELVNPVNSILHTSGLKNFADVGITSSVNAGVTAATEDFVIAVDLLEEKRVDTINNFDHTIDIDAVDNKSKFLKFRNTKLSPYIECKTNRVLEIDDISPLFSNAGSNLNQSVELSIDDKYANFLVQVRNPNNGNIQISDIVLFKDQDDVFTVERAKVHSTPSELGELKAEIDSSDNITLKFTPDDPYLNDYDLKVFKSGFNTDLSGIGTQSIGFVDLSGINKLVGAGSSQEIISDSVINLDAYFASIEVVDKVTTQSNYVELYLTTDGTNVYTGEYYTDSEDGSISNFIGTFTSSLDSNILSLTYENTTSNQVDIRSRIIGIGKTTAGDGTYRFKQTGQSAGTERTLIFEANYENPVGLGTTAVIQLEKNKISTVKSFVRVSTGNTSAMHQVMMAHNGTDSKVTTYPFLSIGSTSGIGTFTSEYSGTNWNLVFHPDSTFSSGSLQIQSFNEAIYTDSDVVNVPPDLQYGTVTDSLKLLQYNAINGTRVNKTDFEIKHNGTPIFEKKFNPTDATVLDPVTGIFTINNHFFETGEELIYTPNDTYLGGAITAMTSSAGTLPSKVYVYKINKDQFKLAHTLGNANSGIGVTFTALGAGNAHELEMLKKLEKSLISIDGIIQSPLAYTPVKTTVSYALNNSATIFAVAGISSITVDSIVKVDNEYMKITNVGLGTTSVGPITNTGTENLLKVERGVVGSAATSHTANTVTRIYAGSYNMVDSKVHFTEPLTGRNSTQKNSSNLPFPRSTFNGRVYLRKDYSTNTVFDDISNSFTGIGQTYRTKVGGANTTGITTGSTFVLMNGIFQTPSTDNNSGNNYSYVGSASSTDISFTGITSTNGEIVISETDVNQNQLPRGGVIVSLGSTGGLGIAPLAGAKVKPTLNVTRGIIGICGIPTTGKTYGISTASYDHTTGEVEITTTVDNEFREINEPVKLSGLEFTCVGSLNVSNAVYNQTTGDLILTVGPHNRPIGSGITFNNNSLTFQCNQDNYGSNHNYPRGGTDPVGNGVTSYITATTSNTLTVNVGIGTTAIHKFVSATNPAINYGGDHAGITTTFFPDAYKDRSFGITGILSTRTFTANVGVTTIPHNYVGAGTVYEYHADLGWGSGYANPVSVGVTDIAYGHKFVSAATGAITGTGGPFTPTNAVYESHTGTLTLTIPSHGRSSGNVQIVENSLTFTCSRDNYQTEHTYPRPAFVHQFVSAVNNAVDGNKTPTAATYNAATGDLELTFGSAHGKSNGQTITIADNSLKFRCSKDNYKSDHDYPRTTDPASGANLTVSGVTSTKLTVNVGKSRTGDPAAGAQNLPITVIDTDTLSVNVGAGGGAGTGAVVTATVVDNTHNYVGGTATGAIIPNAWGTTPLNVNAATYNPETGILVVTTTSNHGLSASDKIGIKTSSLTFTCAQDNHNSNHSYPRVGDPIDGLINLAITTPAANKISVNVGAAPKGTGGALKFAITGVGTDYVNPKIFVDSPSYSNLGITGVSRRGIGSTTDTGTGVTLSVDVGGSSTSGIGSTSFTVTGFDIHNYGYNFREGDVFKAVGLVTDRFRNSSSMDDFELTVLKTYNDKYSSWNVGEFDYIDSIKDLQDGSRKRFPIMYNSTLLSFEINPDDQDSSLIDLNSLLLVFINGVVQEPGEAYSFDGGTSFVFTVAPEPEDNISVFFYKGTNNVDSVLVGAGSSLFPTLKEGDVIQVLKLSTAGITTTQDPRTIYSVAASDKVETNLYSGVGIDENNYKPINWTKQKIDKRVGGDIVYKSRDSIESLVYPTSRIIGDLSTTETQLFVDNARFFNYEEDWSSLVINSVGGLIINEETAVAAGFTATVGAGGTISALTITGGGRGYVGSTTPISISAPPTIGVGVGTTATATATITNGIITGTTITNGGIGYTVTAPPQVIAPFPSWSKEDIDTITTVQGFDGGITGIAVTDGIGSHDLAIKFTLQMDTTNNPNATITDLQAGYPIYIFDTQIGHGVTSVNSSNAAVVGVGTTCLDNVYIVSAFNSGVGIITCNVDTGITSTGISTSVGIGSAVGGFSWGRLSGFTRSTSPVSIGVTGRIASGLSTYPTIQRRDYGLRSTGAARKDLG